jgi:hypothetical protein
MKKIKNDPLNDQRDKSMDKANVVFLKLYAKRRGKYKGWSDVRAETLPGENEIKPKISTES